LASPGAIWWCALALGAGGALLVLAVLSEFLVLLGILDLSPPCYEVCTAEDRRKEFLISARSLVAPFGVLLVPAGLSGVWLLLKERPAGVPRVLAKVGSLLAVSAVTVLVYLVHQRTSFVNEVSQYFFWGVYAAGLVGLLLLGVAALYVRGLGRFRFLPLVLWLLVTPLPLVLINSTFSCTCPTAPRRSGSNYRSC
jgi:hypothetical protein